MADTFPFSRIGIIGSGRVARALAVALADPARPAILMWARDAARMATAVAQSPHAQPSPDLKTLIQACDVVGIAVTDEALPRVVSAIAALQSLQGAPVVFHVSGSTGAAPLEPLRRIGALTAAIHPAMTFTGNAALEAARMSQAYFAVTGSTPAATTKAVALVAALGGTAVEIGEHQRTLYHAALCHAANHLVTLLSGATKALGTAGVPDPGAFVAPLVRAALENTLTNGFEALSGPILRGDAGTIRAHVAALQNQEPALLPSYRSMACATIDELARQEHAVGPQLTDALACSTPSG